MGSNGNLVFDPAEVTIAAGESVHFVNNMLPPHNVVVEDHPELSHEIPTMLPGEDLVSLPSMMQVITLIGVLHIKVRA